MRLPRIVFAFTLVLSLAILSGCALLGKDSSSGQPATSVRTDALPSDIPSTHAPPGPEATTPPPAPTTANPHTTKPAPPPTPTVASEGHCAGFTGTNVSKATILRDLTVASKHNEWAGMDPAYL